MQNEELTKELNALQEKFNKEIEDVKKKYEKVNRVSGESLYENGTWAEIVKETTIDDLASYLSYSNFDTVKHRLIQKKQEIINALNNL